MKFNIITACIRPENLKWLFDSFIIAKGNLPIKIEWFIVMEARNRNPELPEIVWDAPFIKTHLAIGDSDKSPINWALDRIDSGLVCWVDDDNIIHPEYFEEILSQPELDKIFIYHQQMSKKLEKTNPYLRYVSLCEPSSIDTAQFTIDRNLIKDIRWDGNSSQPDGKFVQEVFRRSPHKLKIIDKILCYYNYLAK